jgi:hypothetical protein
MSNILLSTAVLLALAGVPASAEEGGTLVTRAGTLTVISEPDPWSIDAFLKVKLGDATVFQAEGRSVTLCASYGIGAQDVVLIDVNEGGVSWQYHALSLLVLEPGKEPRTISDRRLVWADALTIDPREAALKDGRLEIDLGWDGGRREIARYDGERLSIVLEDRGRPPLSEEECKEVHASMEQCASLHENPYCSRPEVTFHGIMDQFNAMTLRSIALHSHHPGFSKRRFTKVCIAACKRGDAPPLDAAFRKAVCGIGK